MDNRSTKLLLDQETAKELQELKKKIHKCDCDVSDLENWIYQHRFQITHEEKIEKNQRLKKSRELKTNFERELKTLLENYIKKLSLIYKNYYLGQRSISEVENKISKFRNLRRESQSDLLKSAEYDFWISFWKEKQ